MVGHNLSPLIEIGLRSKNFFFGGEGSKNNGRLFDGQ